MCKASMEAAITRDPEPGDGLRLGMSEEGLPAFRRPSDPQECVTCIRDGQELWFKGIPRTIQQELKVPPEMTVMFVEQGDDVADMVRLPDDRVVDLWDFFPPHSSRSGVEIIFIALAIDERVWTGDRLAA